MKVKVATSVFPLLEAVWTVPQYPLCICCVPKAINLHGTEVDFDDVCKMCVESPTYRAYLDERLISPAPLAHLGRSERLSLKIDGYTAADFARSHYGVEPQDAGMPSTREVCPVHGHVDIFWVPPEAGKPRV